MSGVQYRRLPYFMVCESSWPTSNDLQSDWTSTNPQNKYQFLYLVNIDFSPDFVISIIKNFKKHHLFDFSHFGTCSFNEILFIFVTSLSVPNLKNIIILQCRVGNVFKLHRFDLIPDIWLIWYESWLIPARTNFWQTHPSQLPKMNFRKK